MSSPRSAPNSVINAERRRALIAASISEIAATGLSRVTLAKIAARADLTAGAVNFYFDSKQALLVATVTFLVEELTNNVLEALEAAEDTPQARLIAVIEASLSPDIISREKVAVWYCFDAEARYSPEIEEICAAQYRQLHAILRHVCDEILVLGNKTDCMNAHTLAYTIVSLIDSLWGEVQGISDEYDPGEAQYIYSSFLSSVFPWCFETPIKSKKSPLTSKLSNQHKIRRADAGDAQGISRLFDFYRQSQNQESNLKLAKTFARETLADQQSPIFVAIDKEGVPAGFVLLNSKRCAKTTSIQWTVENLYVDAPARRQGVASELLNAMRAFVSESGASLLEAQAPTDNLPAQLVMEGLGFLRYREAIHYRSSVE